MIHVISTIRNNCKYKIHKIVYTMFDAVLLINNNIGVIYICHNTCFQRILPLFSFRSDSPEQTVFHCCPESKLRKAESSYFTHKNMNSNVRQLDSYQSWRAHSDGCHVESQRFRENEIL